MIEQIETKDISILFTRQINITSGKKVFTAVARLNNGDEIIFESGTKTQCLNAISRLKTIRS